MGMKKIDYSFARPVGSKGPWEKVLGADRPLDVDLSHMGPDNCWKLEHSGWTSHVEFKCENSN